MKTQINGNLETLQQIANSKNIPFTIKNGGILVDEENYIKITHAMEIEEAAYSVHFVSEPHPLEEELDYF